MKRDYTKNLDNAITDCIANTDKTLNDVISHVFELIMSAEQSEYLGYVHNKRHDKNNLEPATLNLKPRFERLFRLGLTKAGAIIRIATLLQNLYFGTK